MLWLYIHFPHLLLDHVRGSRSETGPVVISDTSQQLVYQACPEARDLGIRPDMRLKTAISLAPDLAIVRAAPQREQQVLEQQAHWLYRYAAHVSLHPPDGLLAEASSVNRLHGSLENLWQKLSQAMEQRRLTGQMAAGLTPRAAQQMARAGTGLCCDDRKALDRSLRSLSIHQAGLPAHTSERLTRLGLATLNDLLSLPPAEIARRLEPETLRLLQQMEGTRPDPQTAWAPPHQFSQRLDFAQDIEQSAGLLFPLQRLLGELEGDLQWRQQDTDTLLLSLHHRNQPETRLDLRTAGPEHRAASFLSLIRLRFERQALAAPVEGMTLAVSRFIDRDRPGGGDLLGNDIPVEEAWQDLVSRLQARLGDQALRVLASHGDHRPEKAWSQGQLRRPVPAIAAGDYPLRPLWLLSTPQPVIHLPEAWLAGPERISGGWWDGERVQRDYYMARLTSGQLAWVFRDVSGGWYIHGLFG